MKKIYLLIVAIIVCGQNLQAQVLEDIITHTWTGVSEQPADFTVRGKATLTQKFKLSLNRSDYSLSGSGSSSINLDGVIYTSHYNLTGWLYVDDKKIYYKSSDIYGDKLPNDLRWCDSWGYLTFYRNANKAGYYLLKGNVDDSCGGKSDLELGDD